MQVLILGCYEPTQHLAPALVNNGHRVTILGQDQKCIDLLSQKLPIETVHCTGSLMEDLQSCHIDNVEVFLALSEDDNQNAMAAQIASHIFNVPRVICHISEASKYAVYKQMGLNVVSSTVAVSDTILQTLQGQS